MSRSHGQVVVTEECVGTLCCATILICGGALEEAKVCQRVSAFQLHNCNHCLISFQRLCKGPILSDDSADKQVRKTCWLSFGSLVHKACKINQICSDSKKQYYSIVRIRVEQYYLLKIRKHNICSHSKPHTYSKVGICSEYEYSSSLMNNKICLGKKYEVRW